MIALDVHCQMFLIVFVSSSKPFGKVYIKDYTVIITVTAYIYISM